LENVDLADTISCGEPFDTISGSQISEIKWIPLRVDSANVFRDIDQLDVINGLYVITDKAQCKVIVFDNDGNLLYSIDRRGQGPEDYLEIAAVTATNTSIYVVDNYAKQLQRYSIKDGSFIETIKMPFVAWDIEAFDDGDFLFTCMNVPPDAPIIPKPIDFAVWRTNERMEITDKYLPLPEDHIEFIGKRRYFNRDAKGNINFHTYRYNGFFTIYKDDSIKFHSVQFDMPIPEEENITYEDVTETNYRYLGETPYVSGNYWVADITQGEYGEQMLASKALKKTLLNSRQDASNMLFNIIGVNNQGFIGYLNYGYDQYSALTQHGFPRADAETEAMLQNDEGVVLIQYIMK